jgi:hypothetical protein
MSDLISRQAVLDKFKALCDACGEGEKYNGVMCRCCALDDGICIVEDAPDAEPEPEEFEWCDDCKEYDQEQHCCHRWTKVIRRTVEEMKTNWIWTPVTEALPKDMDRLLVTIVRSDGSKRVRSGHYYKGYFMMDNGDTWNKTDKEVLAWMPLVEPWRGE